MSTTMMIVLPRKVGSSSSGFERIADPPENGIFSFRCAFYVVSRDKSKFLFSIRSPFGDVVHQLNSKEEKTFSFKKEFQLMFNEFQTGDRLSVVSLGEVLSLFCEL